MLMDMDGFTLDQLSVFVTTVESGSFSGAARRLGRAQSAITYTVQKLEDQAGTALFDRDGYRPRLTHAGAALLPRARQILFDAAELRTHSRAMARGLEAELSFGLTEMVPIARLAPVLAAFRAAFPTVALRIVRGSFGLAHALVQGSLDIALLVDLHLPDILERNRFTTMDLVAVAAPSHPLAAVAGPITEPLLRETLQIVLTEHAGGTVGQDHGVAALRTWRVNDLASKHALLCSGIGWGSMPEPFVADDIAAERLVALPVERWDGSDHMPRFDVVAACHRSRRPGSAGAALLESLRCSAAP